MIPPKIVKFEPEHIQQMYIREFERIEELTDGNVLAAKQAADRLLRAYKTSKPRQEQHTVTIRAKITEMDAVEVLPKNILQSIKRKFEHPFFAVCDIGGEGPSTGNASKNSKLITKRKIWSFKAIKELARKIRERFASVIIGHGNSRSVGRVIHAFNKTIGNTLHALAVIHLTDNETIRKVRTKELDTCSVEGNVTLARASRSSEWYIKDVESIDKLALGSTKLNRPGFSSATILATIQELEGEDNVDY